MLQSNAGMLSAEQAQAGEEATARLVQSMMSRRTLFRRGAVGAAVLSGTGVFASLAAEAARADGMGPGNVLAEPPASSITPVLQIFEIAAIAEQLAVTLYDSAQDNATALGLRGLDLDIIVAAGIEEQIHHDFFTAVIGLLTNSMPPVTVGPTTFSFPLGAKTFSDLSAFIATQQALEGVFDSAFLAAIRELSHQGQHRAAQIAGQIACIESEHRTLGRAIAANHGIRAIPDLAAPLIKGVLNPPPSHPEPNPVPSVPPDDWAFAPVFLESVSDAPGLIKTAGFLSPTSGNSYTYQHINFNAPVYTPIYQNVFFREPTINLGPMSSASASSVRSSSSPSGHHRQHHDRRSRRERRDKGGRG